MKKVLSFALKIIIFLFFIGSINDIFSAFCRPGECRDCDNRYHGISNCRCISCPSTPGGHVRKYKSVGGFLTCGAGNYPVRNVGVGTRDWEYKESSQTDDDGHYYSGRKENSGYWTYVSSKPYIFKKKVKVYLNNAPPPQFKRNGVWRNFTLDPATAFDITDYGCNQVKKYCKDSPIGKGCYRAPHPPRYQCMPGSLSHVDGLNFYAEACEPPTCSVSLNKTIVTSGNSNTLTINFSGNAYSSRRIGIWIRRVDLAPVPQLQSVAIYTHYGTNPERYYYFMAQCNPGDYLGCNGSYTLPNNLPIGEYVVHCDTDANANPRCSGNTMCDYYGGPFNCTADDWRPCSNSDHATFKIFEPPTLSTLRIDAAKNDPDNSTSVGAIRSLSGLKKKTGINDDPSIIGTNINGSSYYNYLLIGQEVDAKNVPNAENIGISGVIFGSTSMPTSITNFSQITSNVSANQGFILLYANKNYTAAQSPIGIATTADRYYVYAPNDAGSYGWSDGISLGDIQGYSSSRIKIIPQPPRECNKTNPLYQQNTNTTRAQLPCFQVFLYRNLTNSSVRTWGTYGYVFDGINHIIQSKAGQPIP